MSEEEKLNVSEAATVLVACVKCTGKTAHKVVASLEKSGYDEPSHVYWDEWHQILKCAGCSTISFRRATRNSEDYEHVGDGEYDYSIFQTLYPSRVEGRKNLGTLTRYFPAKLRHVYVETVTALADELAVLAGVGLRAMVEIVCNEKNAQGTNLEQKIDSLAKLQVLTPSGATVLHKVRSLGNKAAHEVEPHTPRQLGVALDVVESMLREVYILPKVADDEL